MPIDHHHRHRHHRLETERLRQRRKMLRPRRKRQQIPCRNCLKRRYLLCRLKNTPIIEVPPRRDFPCSYSITNNEFGKMWFCVSTHVYELSQIVFACSECFMDNPPRNNSYRSQSRYVLRTSDSQ